MSITNLRRPVQHIALVWRGTRGTCFQEALICKAGIYSGTCWLTQVLQLEQCKLAFRLSDIACSRYHLVGGMLTCSVHYKASR